MRAAPVYDAESGLRNASVRSHASLMAGSPVSGSGNSACCADAIGASSDTMTMPAVARVPRPPRADSRMCPPVLEQRRLHQ